MMISPILTPFRWYDKFYEQTRYDIDCSNECEFKLITDRGHLLPFQFRRDASPHGIDKWILRRACDPAEPKLLSPENSVFYGSYLNNWQISNCNVRTIDTGSIRTLSDGSNRTIGVSACNNPEKVCNVLRCGGTNGATATLPELLVVGKRYRLSVSISELSIIEGSNLNLDFTNSATVLLDGINSIGYFEVEFTATDVNFGFTINADTTVGADDYISIGEVQIVEILSDNANDILLDKSLLNMATIGSTNVIVYCGDSLGRSLPTGDYYSIIRTFDNKEFYSEVITIMDFVTNKAPHYILEWRNTCDIQDVIYQSINSGNYLNRLYLNEAVMTKPEYPISEEGEEDGDNNLNVTFQKWEKDVQLIIGKCPEYVIDALTGIRLHDTITITKPIRKEQLQATESMEVMKSEHEVTYIFGDCFANVSLRLLLADKYVDSACCTNNSVTAITCTSCDETFDVDLNDFSSVTNGDRAFSFGTMLRDNGPYQYNSGTMTWDAISFDLGTVVCLNDASFVFIEFDGDQFWVSSVTIQSITYLSGVFHVTGLSFDSATYVRVGYSLDGGDTWIYVDSVTEPIFRTTGVDINLIYQPGILFIANNYSLSCDFGYSPIYDYDNP